MNNIDKYMPSLTQLMKSEKLSRDQQISLKKSVNILHRAIMAKNRKIIAKEIGKICKIILESFD